MTDTINGSVHDDVALLVAELESVRDDHPVAQVKGPEATESRRHRSTFVNQVLGALNDNLEAFALEVRASM